MNEQESVFTLEEACAFLRISINTGYAWIKSGRLRAGRTGATGKTGDYRLLKSDCIASIRPQINNQNVNAVDQQDEGLVCQSLEGPTRGTVISIRQVGKELDNRLGQRTSGKLRSCTTD